MRLDVVIGRQVGPDGFEKHVLRGLRIVKAKARELSLFEQDLPADDLVQPRIPHCAVNPLRSLAPEMSRAFQPRSPNSIPSSP